MSETVTLVIDGHSITIESGSTILEAAKLAGIDIPVICYHENLTANGVCRMCMVDTNWRTQTAACVTKCSDDMTVDTRSERVIKARRTILELLASTVNLDEAPEIQMLMHKYDASESRFSGEKRKSKIHDDNPFFIRDYTQCVNCWRCVQICAEDAQYAFALSFDGRGFNTSIGTFMGNGLMDTTCVFCGQCVGVCPTGALKTKRQALLEKGHDPSSIFSQTRRQRKSPQKSNH